MKTVLTHGCFDVLHSGHIQLFKEAKQLGDILTVSITADDFITKPNHPILPFAMRIENLQAIKYIDKIITSHNYNGVQIINDIKPDVYVKGVEYQGIPNANLQAEIDAVEAYGGQVVYIPMLKDIHSTKLTNNIKPEFKEFISGFKQKYSIDDILVLLESFKDLDVLVFGESIIDVYTYVGLMDKAPKTSVLATKYLSQEIMAGGAVYLANTIAEFAKSVRLVTYTGQPNLTSQYIDNPIGFIKGHLSDNVYFHVIELEDRPTIIKERLIEQVFAEQSHRNTLFEVCHIDTKPIVNGRINEILDSVCPVVDLSVIMDYGHGLLSENSIGAVIKRSHWTALNVQANESNYGFNTKKKYKDCSIDYSTMDETELRLNMACDYLPTERLGSIYYEKNNDKCLAISLGRDGILAYKGTASVKIPVIPVDNIIDTVGCGDAFYGLTSLCAYKGAEPDLLGFLGNIIGGLKLGKVCTKDVVTKSEIINKVKELLS